MCGVETVHANGIAIYRERRGPVPGLLSFDAAAIHT